MWLVLFCGWYCAHFWIPSTLPSFIMIGFFSLIFFLFFMGPLLSYRLKSSTQRLVLLFCLSIFLLHFLNQFLFKDNSDPWDSVFFLLLLATTLDRSSLSFSFAFFLPCWFPSQCFWNCYFSHNLFSFLQTQPTPHLSISLCLGISCFKPTTFLIFI